MTGSSIYDMTEIALETSKRWFPCVFDPEMALVPTPVHFALALSGEVGEVANQIKKAIRNGDLSDINMRVRVGEELADVLSYLMLIADSLEIDLVSEFHKKVKKNEARFGDK